MNDLPEHVQRLYQEVILQHSRAPRHAQRPARVDGVGVGDNPMCGDHVEVFVARDDRDSLVEIGFEARGCAISIASADLMAQSLRGASPKDAAQLAVAFQRMIEFGDDAALALTLLRPFAGVHEYRSRHRCALLPWQALLQAIGSVPREQAA